LFLTRRRDKKSLMNMLKVLSILAWLVIGSATFVGLLWIGVPEILAFCAVCLVMVAYVGLLYFLDARGVFGLSEDADE
jgi:uncharacterized membrane protein